VTAVTAAPVEDLEGLTESIGALATEIAEQLRNKIIEGRTTKHPCACGQQRHDTTYLSGWLRGLASTYALATGEDSETVYERMRPKV
jgi:hypothetical protein